MTPALTHPLISAYLHDLELLLHGIDPGERAEVLAGVHEHLDATLPSGASDDDVRRTLGELGSPQSVADEAYAGRPPVAAAPSAMPTTSGPRPSALSRSWVPIVVILGLTLSLFLIILVTGMGASYLVSSSSGMDSAGNVTDGPEVVHYGGAFPGATVAALLFSALLWLPPLVICLASSLWTSKEKGAAVLSIPAAAVLLTALPDIGWALSSTAAAINVAGWIALALAVLGGGYLLVRLYRSGIRRAEAIESGGKR